MMSDKEDDARKTVANLAARFDLDLPQLPQRSAFGARWWKKEDQKLQESRLAELTKTFEVVNAVLNPKTARYQEDKRGDAFESQHKKKMEALELQAEAIKLQADKEFEAFKFQHKKTMEERENQRAREEAEEQWRHEAFKFQAKKRMEAIKLQAEKELDAFESQHKKKMEAFKLQKEKEFELQKYTEAITPGEFAQCPENQAKDEKSLETATSSRTDNIKVESDMRTWATIELDKLQNEFGKFSYYMWQGKLRAHLEDEKARQNSDCINAAFNDIAQRYLQGQECVSVEVSDRPLNAVLCAPKIGSKLTVNHSLQTAGMYVLHRSAVHWISVAHNYVRPPCTALTEAAFNENPLRAAMKELARRNVHLHYGDEPLLMPDEHEVLSSMPYACLKHKPQDRMGRNLLHTVDIMIGQVPEVARRHEVRGLESLEDLYKVRGRTGFIYSIQKVWWQRPFIGSEHAGYTRYDITLDPLTYERYKIVSALLPGNNLAEGTIIKPSFGSIYLDGEQYHNVLLISSSNGVSPRYGDSGSIWVARDSSEAVAITVGKMTLPEAPCGEVWVAILLFPCLEELCREYPDALADVSELTLFQGQPLADIDSDN